VPIEETAFRTVALGGTAAAPLTFELSQRSAGILDPTGVLTEPLPALGSPDRPLVEQPRAPVIVDETWHWDRELSWYGPGFYGQRTACGQTLTTSLIGVAHRTLPCGTLVTFRNPVNGRTLTLPVVDRGPYVYGRIWDLTGGACLALDHCWTGSMWWKLGR
jgi:hypothetical protein